MQKIPQDPSFTVGNVPVYGNVILSPMAGYSDVPYRAICRAFGSAMHYTEFVPVEALQGKRNRFWQRLDQIAGDDPMVFQIFGNNPQMILDAALRIESLEPDIIDINMGCSTKRVSGRGAGVGMMKDPSIIAETFALLSQNLSIPVTGKIRLGWEANQNYLEVAKILEDNGAALVAMHARTKEQKYTGTAKWDAIAELKQAVNIPVIGNGDIFTPDDIDAMLDYTGCDGVMIGRGAIGNPWIFGRLERSQIGNQTLHDTIRHHISEMASYYGEAHGMPMFRKHFKSYMRAIPESQPLISDMLQLTELDQFFDRLASVFEEIDRQGYGQQEGSQIEAFPLNCEPVSPLV